MRAFFASLDARRQVQMVSAAAFVFIIVAALSSWQTHRGKTAAVAALAEVQANLQAMDELVARYSALQGGGVVPGNEDLAALVNRTLQGRGFQPTRIQQGADGGLQVRLDDVAFADALAWLMELENTNGVVVGAVSVSQGSAGGTSLTLVLRGA